MGSALLKLVKNVTEPTVLKYCLARMEELLPGTGGAERFLGFVDTMALTLCIILYGFRTDGLRLHKRMVYFVPEGATWMRLRS